MERYMREDYTQHSDEELLIRLRDGEQGITDHIMNKYKNLVRSKAKSMYILGADSEDLIQEGMIGLFKASPGRCTRRCRLPEGRNIFL